MAETNLFKWRQYQPEIIVLCVRWYLRYALSYRDLEELMAERGLGVDHTTIYRWVQRYAPELERRVKRSGSQGALLPPSPLRTAHMSFPIRGSSLS
jgi:transposase-like protein